MNVQNNSMQFSLRILFGCVFLIALALSGRLIYFSIWENHCRNMEPSLFRSILDTEFNLSAKQKSEFYLAKGSPQDSDWTQLEPEFIAELKVGGIRFFDGSANGPVIYIGNIHWNDWQTVLVDFGCVQETGQGYGFEKAMFRIAKGKWCRIEPGTEWITSEDSCVTEPEN